MISALFADAGTNREALTAGAAMIFLFGVFYSLCGDVCVFVIIGEIFPNHLRAKGSLVAMGANALTNLVYLQVSPTAFDAIGWKYFLVSLKNAAVTSHRLSAAISPSRPLMFLFYLLRSLLLSLSVD